MEYPPLVAGHTALFAVHLTTLADFKPVTSGQARVEFTPENDGQPTALAGPQPSRPGAFRVEGAPPAAGRYRWALVLDAPGFSDRHDLGPVQVFADEATANAEAAKRPAEDAAAIAYLKAARPSSQLRPPDASWPRSCHPSAIRSALVPCSRISSRG